MQTGATAAGHDGRAAVPASLFVLIALTQFPGAMALTVTAPLLASMAADLVHPGMSIYLVKLITGIVAPALIVGAPLAGWLADRYDRRPLIAVFGVVFIASAMAPAFLDSLMEIVVSRFVTGASGGALATIGMAMVGHYYGEGRRAGVIGTLAFLTLTVSVLTLPVAGALAHGGWRHAFLVFLALTPMPLLALLRPLRAPAQAARAAAGNAAPIPRLRLPAAIIAIALAIGLALNLAGIFYSFYFTELGVRDVRTIALLLMGQALVAGIATLLFGRASRRWSLRTIFIICFCSTTAGLAIQGLATDWRVAGASLVLTGLSMGWLVANLSASVIALVDERHHGAALGLGHAISAVAALLGISQPLQTALGIKGIFLSVAGFCALVLLGLAGNVLKLDKR
ncbi:MAG: MFS transporter [Sphingomonadales bacterium]|nr:MFS transporter [Sphingomonadales bacterium]